MNPGDLVSLKRWGDEFGRIVVRRDGDALLLFSPGVRSATCPLLTRIRPSKTLAGPRVRLEGDEDPEGVDVRELLNVAPKGIEFDVPARALLGEDAAALEAAPLEDVSIRASDFTAAKMARTANAFRGRADVDELESRDRVQLRRRWRWLVRIRPLIVVAAYEDETDRRLRLFAEPSTPPRLPRAFDEALSKA